MEKHETKIYLRRTLIWGARFLATLYQKTGKDEYYRLAVDFKNHARSLKTYE